MEVKFLKAGAGDAILIHHEKKNILIDGGNDSTIVLQELDKIFQAEGFLDLMVITHHDDDHIRGAIEVLEAVESGRYGKGKDFVKDVIFNSPRQILKSSKLTEEGLLSYSQALDIDVILEKLPSRRLDVTTHKSSPLIYEGLTMRFLSPTDEILKKYSRSKGALLYNKTPDWDEPLADLERWIDDTSLDKGPVNRTSIVILVECEGKKILLTGDVTPDRFQEIVQLLYEENNGKPIALDYCKLPHHGSYRSISKEIMSKILCSNYIITTDGKSNKLPDKKALLKVIKYQAENSVFPINFIFNYHETIEFLKITQIECATYNFSLIKNNHNYGYSI